MQDYQRSKVYAWEDSVIHSRDRSSVDFEQAQSLVDYVWQSEGLEYPPKVKPMPEQNKHSTAHATRLEICIREKIKTTILLHEIAHSMTSEALGGSNFHCERFVGVYMMLLSKYAGCCLPELMYTAEKNNVKFNFKGCIHS